jgi:polyhydroxybutyrate depolymerase
MALRRRVLRLVEFACAGVLLLVSGCGTFMFSNRSLEEGTFLHTTSLHYGPLARTYLLHVPRNYDGEEARPLVLVLHGAFSTAGEMERRSGFSPLADREGFFVAYPNGIGLFGFLQHWNAGHCCGLAKMDNVDDVGFLCYVIGDASRRFRIDASRIYVVGHSNGGMLAYEFARARCRETAAIAVVAGTLGSAPNAQERPEMVGPPQHPVPLLAIHGWDDQTVPVEGGTRSSNGPRYASVFDSVGAWARYCACEPSPRIDVDPQTQQCTVTWCNDTGEAFVVLRILNYWPHKWPGTFFTGSLPPTNPLRGFDGAQVIWNFLRVHRRAAD